MGVVNTATCQTTSSVSGTSTVDVGFAKAPTNTLLPAVLWYIVPGYMEEKRISETLEYLTELIKTLMTFNIKLIPVLIDDGSTDNTYKIMRSYSSPTGSIATKIEHGGRGAALQAGVYLVGKKYNPQQREIIILSAADLKLPLSDFLDCYKYIDKEGWDGVFFSKNIGGSLMVRSNKRHILSLFYNRISRILFSLDYMDTQGVKFITLNQDTLGIFRRCKEKAFTYDTELAIELSLNGMKIKEVPYHIKDSSEKDSKVNYYTTLLMLLGLLKLAKKSRFFGYRSNSLLRSKP